MMVNKAEPGARFRALAIHTAADAGQTVELAQLVAAARGNVDVWTSTLKRTALMKACHRASQGHEPTVEMLLALKADPNAVDNNNQTPLHWAAHGGNVDVVKTLLRSGAKAARQDTGGRVPAFIAGAKQFRKIVSLLVTEGAATPPKAAANWGFRSYWTPDQAVSQCMCCKHTKFSLSNRRHHCRWCGDVVCGSCSRKTKLKDSPVLKAELVCFTCFQKMLGGDGDAAAAGGGGGGRMMGVGPDQLKRGGAQELKYKPIKLLGRGAFGDTSLVFDSAAATHCARKEIVCKDLDEANAAIKEAMVMLQLKHRGLVECLDLWMGIDVKQQHTANILMEYCSGGDLYQYVTKAKAPIPESEVVRLITDVLAAVAYIHAHNVIHRDIKLANIMLTAVTAPSGVGGDGGVNSGVHGVGNGPTRQHQLVAKLGDFGLAKKMKGKYAQSVSGTLVYMAPEQQRGMYDAKVDVWALGATVVAMCNRRELSIVVATKSQAGSLAQSVPTSIYSSAMVAAVSAMLTFEPHHRPTAVKVLTLQPFAARSEEVDAAAPRIAVAIASRGTATTAATAAEGALPTVKRKGPLKKKMLNEV